MRTVELPDGGRLQLRPVRPADKPRFLAAYEHLGPESRYRRFLVPHGDLTPAELRYFTEVDHYDHEAIVALDAETGDGVGVARYVRDPRRFDTAELAVTVVDDWQGRGVGTALLHELLKRARRAGVTRAVATVLTANRPSLELMREIGHPHVLRRDPGVEDITIEIPPDGLGDLGVALRRAAANMPVSRSAAPAATGT